MSGWLDSSDNANCFKQTYVQGFVDISGGSIITRGPNDGIVIGGDSSLNGTVYLGDSMFVRSDGLVAPGDASNGATAVYVDASYVDVSGGAFIGEVVSYDISGGPTVAGSTIVGVSFPSNASWSKIGGDISANITGFFVNSTLSDDGTILVVSSVTLKIIYKYRTVSEGTWGSLVVGNKLGDVNPVSGKKYWVAMSGGQINSAHEIAEISGDRYIGTAWTLIHTSGYSSYPDAIAMSKDGNVAYRLKVAVYNNNETRIPSIFTRENNTWTETINDAFYNNRSMATSHIIAKDAYNNYYVGVMLIQGASKPTISPINILSRTVGAAISTIDELLRPAPDNTTGHLIDEIQLTHDGKYLVVSHNQTTRQGSRYISVFYNNSTSSIPTYYRYAQFTCGHPTRVIRIDINADASVIATSTPSLGEVKIFKRTGTSYSQLGSTIIIGSNSTTTIVSDSIRTNADGTFVSAGNYENQIGAVYEITNTDIYSDVSGGFLDVQVIGGYLNDGLTSAALYVNGDTDLSGGLTVSGDVSFNSGNLFVAGDLSLNGNLFINSFAANSINADAIDSTVDIEFANKLSVSTSDLSFNKTALKVATNFNSNNTLATLAANLTVPANIAIVDGSNGTVYGSYLTLTNKAATAYYNVGKSASGLFNIVDQANAGVYLASGGTSFTGTSDARLKTNIAPLESATDKIMALNPCTYQWKSDVESTETDHNNTITTKTHIGFIAQEVEKIMPELVHPIDHPAGSDYKGVNTTDLIPYLVRMIQENQQCIDSLRTEIRALSA
jgi:hypothetical protein